MQDGGNTHNTEDERQRPVEDELDVLRRTISKLEENLADCEPSTFDAADEVSEPPAAFSFGDTPQDFSDADLGSLDADPLSTGNLSSLPSEHGEHKKAFQELGNSAHKDRSVRGPRIHDAPAKSRRRRRSISTSKSDLRKAKLASLGSTTPSQASTQKEPAVSRRTKISFEEEKEEADPTDRLRTGGQEMLTARRVAKVGSAVAFAGIVVAIIALAGSERAESPKSTPPLDEWSAQQEIVMSAQDTVIDYLEAPTLEEKARFVWDADRVQPLMEQYYRSHQVPKPSDPVEVTVVSNRANHSSSELPEIFVLAAFADEVGKIDDVILRPNGKGFLIDWEASVGYNPASISALLAERSLEPITMRVLVIPATYYNYQFSDRKQFQSFAIKVEDNTEQRCYAFAHRQSPAFRDLAKLFANRDLRSVKVTVTLRFPPGEDPVAELLTVVKPHWALDPDESPR